MKPFCIPIICPLCRFDLVRKDYSLACNNIDCMSDSYSKFRIIFAALTTSVNNQGDILEISIRIDNLTLAISWIPAFFGTTLSSHTNKTLLHTKQHLHLDLNNLPLINKKINLLLAFQ